VHFAFVTSDSNNVNYEVGGYEYAKGSADDDTLVDALSGYSGEPYTVLLTELHVKDTESLAWAKCLPLDSAGVIAYNERVLIPSNEIAASGTRVRVAFKAQASHDLIIDGASIGPRDGSTVNFASDPVRLKFSGNDGITVSAGSVAWSDWTATYDFDKTKDHLVHYKSSQGGSTNYFKDSIVLYAHEYYKFTTADDVLTLSPSGYVGESVINSVTMIEADDGGTPPPVTGPTQAQLLRHGTWFGDGVKQRMWWTK
jgi:hypothetical protein